MYPDGTRVRNVFDDRLGYIKYLVDANSSKDDPTIVVEYDDGTQEPAHIWIHVLEPIENGPISDSSL